MKSKLLRQFLIIYLLIIAGFLYSEDSLKLTFAGDIMAHVNNLILPDYNLIYSDIKDMLLNDDLSFANLEFTINDSKGVSGYPRFNVHRDYVEAAVDSGFNVFSCANNHINDFDLYGIFQTVLSIEYLKRKYGKRVYFSGLRGNLQKEFIPEIINIKNHKVYFIALSQFLNRMEISSYVDVLDYHEKSKVESFLNYIKTLKDHADLIIISYHGGLEYSLKPDKDKVVFFHKAIKSGADIIYSHHPHVLQPYEILKYRGERKLIIYSAGNLVSGMGRSLNIKKTDALINYTGDSALFSVNVSFKKDGADITKVSTVPIAQVESPEGYIVVKKIKDLTDTDRQAGKNSDSYSSGRLRQTSYYKKRLKLINKLLHGRVN